MANVFKKIWDSVTAPFTALVVILDESKNINEDGSWDKYLERKNRGASKKAEKGANNGKEIFNR